MLLMNMPTRPSCVAISRKVKTRPTDSANNLKIRTRNGLGNPESWKPTLSCFRSEHAYKTFVRGDLKESQDEAHRQCQQLEDSNPEWAWKSRILEANSLLWPI